MQSFLTAINNGDTNAAAAVFSDNAIMIHAPATGECSRQSPCMGRPAILADLKELVAEHHCFTMTEVAVTGTVVTAHVEARNDNARANGIERVLVVFTELVQQNKIAAHYVLPDLTDPQSVANSAIKAGTQPPGIPVPNPATPCG
jgi:hypothetical protein